MSLRLGLFGKLPTASDFVRLEAAAEPFGSFDTWLVSSVEWAHQRGGDPWRRAFASGCSYAFVYRAPAPRRLSPLLVGVLGPSADRAGRQFPLSVAVPYPVAGESLACPELLPIVFEPLWHKASDVVAEGSAGVAIESHLGLFEFEPCALPEAGASYQDWITNLPPRALWELLYGEDYGEQPEYVLRLLTEALRPYRQMERPKTPLTLWLPLGRVAGASVCVWLDLVRRLAGWQATLPSFFWSHDGSDGRLLLHLGDPPPCTVAELWLPNPERNEIVDLASPVDPVQLTRLPPLSAEVAAASLNAPSVAELLALLVAG
ncbi:MAG TPA: type VI secretion system-associated protein TagF [Polyangiaceae bacterium]|nr:type VI secretion system-associated protein TagF [Polyangiaceae bacterium]